MILYLRKRIRDGGGRDWRAFGSLGSSCYADRVAPTSAAAFIIPYVIDVTVGGVISRPMYMAIRYYFKLVFGET